MIRKKNVTKTLPKVLLKRRDKKSLVANKKNKNMKSSASWGTKERLPLELGGWIYWPNQANSCQVGEMAAAKTRQALAREDHWSTFVEVIGVDVIRKSWRRRHQPTTSSRRRLGVFKILTKRGRPPPHPAVSVVSSAPDSLLAASSWTFPSSSVHCLCWTGPGRARLRYRLKHNRANRAYCVRIKLIVLCFEPVQEARLKWPPLVVIEHWYISSKGNKKIRSTGN